MKKYALLITLVLVVASTTWANLLSNPGFESGLIDWQYSGSVGDEEYGTRSGTNGIAFYGWNWAPDNKGEMGQKVSVTATGEYTFSVWVKAEANYSFQTNNLKLEWFDSSDAVLQDATIKEQSVPNDGFWHRIYVTGTCISNDLSYVKGSLVASWNNASSDPRSYAMDDAVLVTGALVKTGYRFSNPSFEDGLNGQWGGSQWWANTNANIARTDWSARSGGWGVSVYGWDDVPGPVEIAQPVYPENTGTFTYTFWASAETEFDLTNGEIRLEFYDETLTNQLAGSSVLSFDMPPEGADAWYQYSITGTCSDVSLYEVRPVISMQWNTIGSGNQAGRIDDCIMRYGDYSGPELDMDWAYYSGEGYNPATEQVPNTNVGTFLQVDYGTTTTTFYVLGNEPTSCHYYPEEQNAWQFRTSYERPDWPGQWVTEWHNMEKIGDIELTAGDFHGLPSAGVHTVGLWKTEWTQPMPTNGTIAPYTADIKVYYSAFTKSTNGVIETDFNYLLYTGTNVMTNNVGQLYGKDTIDQDYIYYNSRPDPLTVFTNGGYENPVDTTNEIADTGWRATGGAWRERWSAQSGERGAYFPSWLSSGTEEYWLFQDVETTSATNTFSIWSLAEVGANPATFELCMEWYDSNLNLLEVDTQSIATLPGDGGWHPAYITGVCTSNNIASVRLAVHGVYSPKTGDPAATLFDNADFYAGEYETSEYLVNGSFEDALGMGEWRGSSWYSIPNRAGDSDGASRKDWAWRSGTAGVALMCFTNDQQQSLTTNFTMYVAQSVTPAPGTHTFSIWMLEEENADLTHAELRMEWYDHDYNQVQPTITNDFTVSVGTGWGMQSITGTCMSNELYEMRVGIYTEWSPVPDSDLGLQACKIDDAHLVSGSESYLAGGLDWLYYNAGASSPQVENVPSTNVGEFMQIEYSQDKTVFYALSDADYAPVENEVMSMGLRYYYYNHVDLYGVTSNESMTSIGDVELSSGGPFHGLPAVGNKTLELWQYDFWLPRDSTGTPITNETLVYYSPYIQRVFNGVETNMMYLAPDTVAAPYTNNYTVNPQFLTDNPIDMDYLYTNLYVSSPLHDGIPVSWWLQYWSDDPPTNEASADNDGDSHDNWDEYITDTVPTNDASYFVCEVTNTTEGSYVFDIMVGPPTSPNREYDVWYKTNLLENTAWTPFHLDVPGVDATTPVAITVTNDMHGVLYYRTGVRVP